MIGTDLENRLTGIVGADSVSAAESELVRHGSDESYHPPAPPDLVVYPHSTKEVVEVVNACRLDGVPIVPFGAGTSLEGHVAALHGGVCVDLTQMNAILEIRTPDLDVTVEAGVTRLQLEAALRPEGVFFPVDPGADATLGGMVSTGASGTTAVRYGTMRENVLALTVVLPDGTVLRTGTRARKSSAGYDLTHLFIGAEGTLGIVTEAVLRVQPAPEAVSAGVCSFPSLRAAVDCVIATVQTGIPVARIELLDELQMEAISRRHSLPHAAAPTLFFEFHGTLASVREQATEVGEIVKSFEGGEFAWATQEEDRRKLWEARHHAYEAALTLRPGSKGFPTDVCVPISRLADCILETKADLDDSGLVAPIVGHVGDGNFHLLLLIDPGSPEELARAQALTDRLVRRAIEMEGTCTGEHGVGYGKAPYLAIEHGDSGIAVMRAIKQALDPNGLMNPGKIVP
jgi:D-lactate dehydrogenase (cytochrome)